MKTSISTRLFLAVLSTALFVALAMGVADSWSFARGFLGYLNELAVARMESVEPRFVEHYRQQGDWVSVRGNPETWFELTRPDDDSEWPPEARPMPVSDLTGAVFRISLLDERGRLVMGFAEVGADAVRQPLQLDGRTVGWLAMTPFQSVTEVGGQRLLRNQLQASLSIGALAVLLAALIAWWVARRLLAPVRRVAVDSRDEVGQLARDFNRLAHILERNEQMRRAFMADVSHELRTPLSVLRGELEALEDGVRRLDGESLHSLQTEVAMLGQLVNDLYELSLADSGALTYRKSALDVAEQLRIAVAMFRERLAERRIDLKLQLPERPLPVFADAGRLQQLFGNLLENSLRYTHAGGRLRIVAQEAAEAVSIDFLDSAPGVDERHLPRLFERFYRGEASRSRTSGGAGLGLAICLSIVEAHGGSLSARPSPLGGLWLNIALPRGAH
ncbi:two-component system, OmpR family, sensor histidine kinase BaeS [Azotobacter beijerinckii]|uniref:histidine kinase n=1 Tax=Azotobacter beijerinckii TaxID=170623 RepID=A0A1H6VP93_9GAMM|nr:ATP-binding protein [Azotobacter beijerinckii]SEJ02052.1 two-component system, OmpR family, sensor histidine kinase BaeS [Azotobacter beijerinckii]